MSRAPGDGRPGQGATSSDAAQARREELSALSALSAHTQRAWPEPPDDAAYHGLAGQIVREVEPHTEADPAAILATLLVCVGNAIGRGIRFAADGAWHHSNLFVAVVGRTSTARKGGSWHHGRRPVIRADEGWAERIFGGLSSGEGLIAAIRDPVYGRRKAKKSEADEADEDGYIEELVDPGVLDKRLLAMESELAAVLERMGRQGNSLSAVLRQAWDGDTLAVMTKSPVRATSPHVSVIAHITPDELDRLLDRISLANGFANRFLWVCAQRSKSLPLGGEADPVPQDLVNGLAKAIGAARRSGELPLAHAAELRLCEVYDAELVVEHEGLLDVVLSRAAPLVRRLAQIYAAVDCARAVEPDHLEAGLAFWRYCRRSAEHLFGGRTGDPDADAIYAALRRSGAAGMAREESAGSSRGIGRRRRSMRRWLGSRRPDWRGQRVGGRAAVPRSAGVRPELLGLRGKRGKRGKPLGGAP